MQQPCSEAAGACGQRFCADLLTALGPAGVAALVVEGAGGAEECGAAIQPEVFPHFMCSVALDLGARTTAELLSAVDTDQLMQGLGWMCERDLRYTMQTSWGFVEELQGCLRSARRSAAGVAAGIIVAGRPAAAGTVACTSVCTLAALLRSLRPSGITVHKMPHAQGNVYPKPAHQTRQQQQQRQQQELDDLQQAACRQSPAA